MSQVDVNGTSLAYVEQGQGQPVVFVHGGSADLRAWEHQLPVFAATYRAIALSCRGYYPNRALQDHKHITLDVFVEDLVGFLRALDLAPVHLVGHSSPGGFGSLLLAQRHPELLRSLVLVEPPAFPLLGVNIPPTPPQILRLLLRHPRLAISFLHYGATAIRPAVKAFERGDDEAGLRLFMKANLGSGAFVRMPGYRFQQAVENVKPLKAQMRAGFPSLSAHDVQSMHVPTLLVSGEKSNLILHGVTQRLEQLLPKVERLTIKDASHNLFESHPQAFNKGVMEFLEKQSH